MCPSVRLGVAEEVDKQKEVVKADSAIRIQIEGGVPVGVEDRQAEVIGEFEEIFQANSAGAVEVPRLGCYLRENANERCSGTEISLRVHGDKQNLRFAFESRRSTDRGHSGQFVDFHDESAISLSAP
jgi:hypothetical protein